MKLKFKLISEIPATPQAIYSAWLDSERHALMTDSESAIASQVVGAEYKAHGEYITGKNIELIPFKKIVQSWRSSSFKPEDEDSLLEVIFEEKGGETQLTLIHSNIPEQEYHVETGWVSHYFEPMKKYFSSL